MIINRVVHVAGWPLRRLGLDPHRALINARPDPTHGPIQPTRPPAPTATAIGYLAGSNGGTVAASATGTDPGPEQRSPAPRG